MLITRIAQWFESSRSKIAFWCALLLTPAGYVAAFPPFGVSEMAFVCLVPFLIWLRFEPSFRKVGLVSFGIGWVSWFVLIFWLHHVTWFGLFGLSAVVGAHFSIWAMGTRWFVERSKGLGTWSGVPVTIGSGALWVLTEYLRTWIFSGFPWLPLSASQWEQPIMLQSASLFGAWGISFSLVILNVGVAGYLARIVAYARHRKKAICPEFYLALGFVVLTSFMLLRLTSGQEREVSLKAGVIQPVIPQDEKWDDAFDRKILSRLELQTLSLSALEPDAVFWPEACLPYPINNQGEMEMWTRRMARQLGKPILAGALAVERSSEEIEWYNSVFLVDPELGLFRQYYSKRHLVPFGEYIPLRSLWPWIEKVVPINGDILPGEGAKLLPLDTAKTTIRIGPLICFEDVFPALARESVREGAGLLYVATNSAWYGKSGASLQHLAHSVLRAVETRRVVVRVGNDGITCWVDEYGNVRSRIAPWTQEWTVWEVSRDRRWIGKETSYVKYGDWFVAVCLALTIATAVYLRRVKPSSVSA